MGPLHKVGEEAMPAFKCYVSQIDININSLSQGKFTLNTM